MPTARWLAVPASVAVSVVMTACGGGPKPQGPGGPGGPGAGSGSAAGPNAPAEAELALDPSIRHGTLPNGLTYYIAANKKPEKRVALWLAVDAGTALETDAQRGLAHMTEHLAFDGTKRFPKHDIQNFIERSGMRFGADLNAYTSFDETVYQLLVPSDDPATVGRGLDVLRDWSSDISFDPQATIDERKIIEEERRLRNNSGLRLAQQIFPVEYMGSPYPQRFPMGTSEVIAGATADKLKAFYTAWYRPDLMAVIVVGDIDPDTMEKEIQERFKDVPAAAGNAPARVRPTIDTTHAPRFVVARDKENTLNSVRIAFQMPHRPQTTTSDIRRVLVEQVFSRLLTERLDLMSKRATSAWLNAGADFESELRPIDEMILIADAKGGKVQQALGDLATELARVRQHGFSADEIQSATASLLQAATEQVREANTRDSAQIVTSIVRHHLARLSLAGPARQLELAKELLPTITNDDLMGLATAMSKLSRVVVVTAPVDAVVPTEKDLEGAIAAADKPVGEWEAVDLSAPLLATDPTPGKIVDEKKLSQGVTVWTLSNGARVYVKPTTFKNDQIVLSAVSNGGLSAVADKDFTQAHFAAMLVNASGWGNYSVELLHKKLAGKKVELESEIDAEQEKISAECSPDDIEAMMQLVHAAFTAPRRDEGAFAKWKAQQKQFADVLAANPEATFLITAFDVLFSNNPRSPLPLPRAKDIEAIDLDKSLAQYRARFANAADFSFVAVGAIDPAKLKPVVEKYLASLPATKAKKETVADVGLRLKKGKVEQTMKIGTEAKSMSLLITWSELPWTLAGEQDARILQRVLDIELLSVLREKLGGTYTVQVQAESGRSPPATATMLVLFESAPDTAKKLEEEAWATLERIATAPISDDTLAKIREQMKKKHDTDVAENKYWVSAITRVARFGDDLDKLVAIDAGLARATKDQIQKTARRFLDKTNRATLLLLPEK